MSGCHAENLPCSNWIRQKRNMWAASLNDKWPHLICLRTLALIAELSEESHRFCITCVLLKCSEAQKLTWDKSVCVSLTLPKRPWSFKLIHWVWALISHSLSDGAIPLCCRSNETVLLSNDSELLWLPCFFFFLFSNAGCIGVAHFLGSRKFQRKTKGISETPSALFVYFSSQFNIFLECVTMPENVFGFLLRGL